jgi:simple sugar transport system permease protein
MEKPAVLNSFPADARERLLEALIGSHAALSCAVVLLGFFVGTVLILLAGRNPAGMYSAVVQVVTGVDLRSGRWNARYIGEWLVVSLPLILCGFSMAFAAQSGLFNIGGEGQYIAGLTAAQFAAFYGPPVPVLHWASALIAAAVFGAVWGGAAGLLKARFKVSEVVATIMMNYIAFYGSRYLTLLIPGTNTFQTPHFPPTARLSSPLLESLTNHSRLNQGLYITIVVILIYWIVMGRTRLGYTLRAVGLNRDAARCAGINVNQATIAAMGASGAFAGLAGGIVALGLFPSGRVLSAQDGYGFDGIAVALVGNSTAWGTALSGLLFGMLKSAQPLMQSRQIPKEITSIITGLVVVFISLRAGLRLFIDWRKKERLKARGAAHEPDGGGA